MLERCRLLWICSHLKSTVIPEVFSLLPQTVSCSNIVIQNIHPEFLASALYRATYFDIPGKLKKKDRKEKKRKKEGKKGGRIKIYIL